MMESRTPSGALPPGIALPGLLVSQPPARKPEAAAGGSLRILVVDDHPFMQSVLSRLLERQGHEIRVAGDGMTAWEMIKKDYFPIMICDWEMPGMDGLTLCRRLRAESSGRQYTYVILLTGRNQKEDYLEGLKAGADDFLVKPVEPAILSARLHAAGRVIRLQQDLSERNRMLTLANEKIEMDYNRLRADLTAAARLQAQLLPRPRNFPGGLSCRGLLLPSDFVSGDVVNCFALPGRDAVAFYVLDVAGHGVRAALSSFMLAKQLRPERFWPAGRSAPDLTALLRDLNREFQSCDTTDYFTMAAGIIDGPRRKLTLALAGHPQPFLHMPGAAPFVCGEPGVPVGMLADADYAQTIYDFPQGSRLLLYSDGVTECARPDERSFGQNRLGQILQSTQNGAALDAILHRIENELRRWRGKDGFADDVSLLAISS